MLDVHQRIHEEKRNIKKIVSPDQAKYFEPGGTYTVKLRPYDPIPPVAKSIIDESWLICFDEFQVCFVFFFIKSINFSLDYICIHLYLNM